MSLLNEFNKTKPAPAAPARGPVDGFLGPNTNAMRGIGPAPMKSGGPLKTNPMKSGGPLKTNPMKSGGPLKTNPTRGSTGILKGEW